MERHERGLHPPHPADLARRLAAGVVGQKQQDVGRRRRQPRRRAQRRDGGMIGVGESRRVGKHDRSGQHRFRHKKTSNIELFNIELNYKQKK